jgi:hypothetical protein
MKFRDDPLPFDTGTYPHTGRTPALYTGYSEVIASVRHGANASNLLLLSGSKWSFDLPYLMANIEAALGPSEPILTANIAVAWHPYEFKCLNFSKGVCYGEDGTIDAAVVTSKLPLLVTEMVRARTVLTSD